MKRFVPFSSFFILALILLLSPASSPAGDSKGGTSETLKGKAKEEMETVKKESLKAGQDFKQSAKELPAQAGKEFKKTGTALKETGKELKESIKESVDEIKKTFTK